ncbi:MAG: TspO/MBR family protein, partial [Propionibacteriaceae bacterium]
MRKSHRREPGVAHPRRARNALVATGIVGATVAVGSAASDPTSQWYVALDKPAWQPPGYVFPIAWTTLYTSIAVAS